MTKNVRVSTREMQAYYRANRAAKYAHSSFRQAKSSIAATLLAQKRGEAKLAWIQKLPSIYAGKISYASDVKPAGG